jgi:hypothetical protein
MSESMIERVARAMAIKDKGDDMWGVMSEDGDGYGYVGKNEYRAMARAAIEAMREPTEGMVEAARLERDLTYTTTRCIFRDMIDEALKG